MFFSYTQCPDVCPTTMVEMANVMKELGPQASKVQVLFVTVDPERDTQELLSKYVPAFDPSCRPVRRRAATDKVTQGIPRVLPESTRQDPGSAMDHTAGSYVFDRKATSACSYATGADPMPMI